MQLLLIIIKYMMKILNHLILQLIGANENRKKKKKKKIDRKNDGKLNIE